MLSRSEGSLRASRVVWRNGKIGNPPLISGTHPSVVTHKGQVENVSCAREHEYFCFAPNEDAKDLLEIMTEWV